jgi:transposase
VSYFGLNPRVRQPGDGRAHHGRITKQGRSLARGLLVEAAWAAAATAGPLHAFFIRIKARRVPTRWCGKSPAPGPIIS